MAASDIRERLERFKVDERFRIENLFYVKMFMKRNYVPLRFNEAQIKLYEAYRWFRDHRMPVRLIICKSRRAGLSTGVEALMFDDTIRNPNTNSLIVANQLTPSENVLSMCVNFWRRMPAYVRYNIDGKSVEIPLRPDLDKKYNNNPPSDKLEFASPLNSKLFIASSKSVDQYLSFDFHNIHATEGSRYDDARELFRSLSPTLSDDANTAQYIESTPNGQAGRGAWFYEQVMDAHLRGRTQYGETKLVFIPWHEMARSFSRAFETDRDKKEFFESLTSSERDILKQFPHVQLEQMHWRRAKLASTAFNRDEELFDQEYPSDIATAFLSSGTSVLTHKAIKRMMGDVRAPVWEGDIYWGESDRRNEVEPIHDLVRRPSFQTRADATAAGFSSHVTDRGHANLKVYRWPKPGERLIIGADIGRGNPLTTDGDFSTICVLVLNQFAKDELVMTWRGKLNPILFGEVCAALSWALRYRVGDSVKAPMLVPEWTGPGSATITYLDQKDLYEVFRYRMPGVHGMPKSKHLGWESNAKTKPYAVNWMVRMCEQGMVDVPSEEVVLELSSYKQLDHFGDEGSYGGAGGRHDDFVSSFQIACAVARLETATLPGDEAIRDIDLDYTRDEPRDEPFDELADQTFSLRDVEDEDPDWGIEA